MRNYEAAKKSGHDIFTLETDLATTAMNSTTLSADRSVEERLAELDDLHARGVISADERTAARAKIIGS